MAYFSNVIEADELYNQCEHCKYGDKPCPIALVQEIYNFDAYGNKVATDILNDLVAPDGVCVMRNDGSKQLTL